MHVFCYLVKTIRISKAMVPEFWSL